MTRLHSTELPQPDLAQLSRQRFVVRLPGANDVHVFQARLPIEPQVRQVLPEESEAFAEKEDRNEREHKCGDERVPAEERLDDLLNRVLRVTRFRAARDEDAGVGDAFHATPSFANALALRQ